ncbi:hypothetical protein SAMN05421858_2896 [Haladaptatus litoreus]|uniref:Uncharacterized protein n=1 Tax=Haladaptatus litoreus TaxID=553468 RepID=A0A1N7C1H4_9EURY|nr:hypothetical protein [Haladaptatus litoreus]SIR57412.1 hypothetical protein SAMN05421858_2896 [Haladaptatus litoreus]
MVTLRWTTDERSDGRKTITLVELVIENSTETPVRIRVGNRLDGRVWPPHREGVPETGWDDGGFEGVVAAGERRSLGYASPSELTGPDDVPAEIVWTERAAEPRSEETLRRSDFDGGDSSEEIQPTAESVVRALGDSRPPADAVAIPTNPELPEAVKSWLSRVEARIERRKRTGRAGEEPLSEDKRVLREVAERIDNLREQVGADG